jgi:hypothetical protein
LDLKSESEKIGVLLMEGGEEKLRVKDMRERGVASTKNQN